MSTKGKPMILAVSALVGLLMGLVFTRFGIWLGERAERSRWENDTASRGYAEYWAQIPIREGGYSGTLYPQWRWKDPQDVLQSLQREAAE